LNSPLSADDAVSTPDHYRERVRSGGAYRHPASDAWWVWPLCRGCGAAGSVRVRDRLFRSDPSVDPATCAPTVII